MSYRLDQLLDADRLRDCAEHDARLAEAERELAQRAERLVHQNREPEAVMWGAA